MRDDENVFFFVGSGGGRGSGGKSGGGSGSGGKSGGGSGSGGKAEVNKRVCGEEVSSVKHIGVVRALADH
ncbi:MAG: hypothetical protein OCU12_01455 [Methanophagales archaeon]|nr:hypothetical protein [Methanophagales archaeon]